MIESWAFFQLWSKNGVRARVRGGRAQLRNALLPHKFRLSLWIFRNIATNVKVRRRPGELWSRETAPDFYDGGDGGCAPPHPLIVVVPLGHRDTSLKFFINKSRKPESLEILTNVYFHFVYTYYDV